MKRFDIEQAKAGKPVCTRSGLSARIISFDRKALVDHIVALVDFKKGLEEVQAYTDDGKYIYGYTHPLDLMMVEGGEQ